MHTTPATLNTIHFQLIRLVRARAAQTAWATFALTEKNATEDAGTASLAPAARSRVHLLVPRANNPLAIIAGVSRARPAPTVKAAS